MPRLRLSQAFRYFTTPAVAQTSYPDQSIRLLVSFAPGGGTDLTARIAAEDLTKRLGKPVLVENKPGAQTAVALELLSKAKNDGYTFLWTTSDGMAILRARCATISPSTSTRISNSSPRR